MNLTVDGNTTDTKTYILEVYAKLWRMHPGMAFTPGEVFSDEKRRYLRNIVRSMADEGLLTRRGGDCYHISPSALELLRLGAKYHCNG